LEIGVLLPIKIGEGMTDKEIQDEMMKDMGLKHDDDKLRMDLIPVDALIGLSQALAHGAKEYTPYNWAKGIKWSKIYAAVLRHLTAWYQGEDIDPDSGLLHIDHALCNLAFLSTYSKHKKYDGFDNRPIKEFIDEK